MFFYPEKSAYLLHLQTYLFLILDFTFISIFTSYWTTGRHCTNIKEGFPTRIQGQAASIIFMSTPASPKRKGIAVREREPRQLKTRGLQRRTSLMVKGVEVVFFFYKVNANPNCIYRHRKCGVRGYIHELFV